MAPVIPRPVSMIFGKMRSGSLTSSAMLTESSKPTMAKKASVVPAVTATKIDRSSGVAKITTLDRSALLRPSTSTTTATSSPSSGSECAWSRVVMFPARSPNVHVRAISWGRWHQTPAVSNRRRVDGWEGIESVDSYIQADGRGGRQHSLAAGPQRLRGSEHTFQRDKRRYGGGDQRHSDHRRIVHSRPTE